MANRFKGEVDFEAQGKSWVLRLGMNDLIELQEALGYGEDDDKFLRELGQMRGMKKIRKIVFIALRGLQADVTEQVAGDIVTELGFQKIVGLVSEALKWSMPDPQGGKDSGKARSPGVTSSSTLPGLA
jgi:hypothetical protein